jgi:hypothetical protein
MAVGWAPNRLRADPNGSDVHRPDTDDILTPHRSAASLLLHETGSEPSGVH